MFIIKTTENASFSNAIDLIDQMAICNIKSGHYKEGEITKDEINCIENF